MSENKAKTKKPPAHEVILARLKEVQEELRKSRIIGRVGLQKVGLHVVCQALLDVLAAMHLPEQERPKILAALREMDSDIIGVHRSHVHLLKELSGGHDPSAETPDTQ